MTIATRPAALPAITLTVDGQPVSVPAGASALDAINTAGIPISQLCKDADMPAIGACRTCLVQIDGVRGIPGLLLRAGHRRHGHQYRHGRRPPHPHRRNPVDPGNGWQRQ